MESGKACTGESRKRKENKLPLCDAKLLVESTNRVAASKSGTAAVLLFRPI